MVPQLGCETTTEEKRAKSAGNQNFALSPQTQTETRREVDECGKGDGAGRGDESQAQNRPQPGNKKDSANAEQKDKHKQPTATKQQRQKTKKQPSVFKNFTASSSSSCQPNELHDAGWHARSAVRFSFVVVGAASVSVVCATSVRGMYARFEFVLYDTVHCKSLF